MNTFTKIMDKTVFNTESYVIGAKCGLIVGGIGYGLYNAYSEHCKLLKSNKKASFNSQLKAYLDGYAHGNFVGMFNGCFIGLFYPIFIMFIPGYLITNGYYSLMDKDNKSNDE